MHCYLAYLFAEPSIGFYTKCLKYYESKVVGLLKLSLLAAGAPSAETQCRPLGMQPSTDSALPENSAEAVVWYCAGASAAWLANFSCAILKWVLSALVEEVTVHRAGRQHTAVLLSRAGTGTTSLCWQACSLWNLTMAQPCSLQCLSYGTVAKWWPRVGSNAVAGAGAV